MRNEGPDHSRGPRAHRPQPPPGPPDLTGAWRLSVVLLDTITDELDRTRVPFALIGAAALAIHGVSRSTLDIDLLVTDRRVLDPSHWTALPDRIGCDVRPGDSADPLAGVIRFRAPGERDVDILGRQDR